MYYTKHAIERLYERYGLSPSDSLTSIIDTPGSYRVVTTDIVGTEVREVLLGNLYIKYVVKDNNIITFLDVEQPLDSILKELLEHKKKSEEYFKGMKTKDRMITTLNNSIDYLKNENKKLKEDKRNYLNTIKELEESNKEKAIDVKLKKGQIKALKKKIESLLNEEEVEEEYENTYFSPGPLLGDNKYKYSYSLLTMIIIYGIMFL